MPVFRSAQPHRPETAGADVYTNLIQAAGRESAAFLRNQEDMRMWLSDPKLTETQRQELTFRKEIEFCEYRALTDQRLGGMYRVIGGEAHLRQAEFREQLAAASTERALELREQRRELLRGPEQEQARGTAPASPNRQEERSQAMQPGEPAPELAKANEPTREMSAAERVKAERIAAMEREDRAIDAARAGRPVGRETSQPQPQPEAVRQQDGDAVRKVDTARPSQQERPEQQEQPERGMSAADRAKAQRIAAMEQEDRASDASRGLTIPREIATPGQLESETGRQQERREERQEAQPSRREQPERVMSEREQAKAARIAGMEQEDRVIDQSRESRTRGDGRDRSEGR